MAEEIIDGTGSGQKAKVDSNKQLHTFSVTETEGQQAGEMGNAYNINTGSITISADSSVLYFKNDEDNTFIVSAIAVGFGAGTTTDMPEITLIKNPTNGTLITNAVAADMVENRNFGSSKTLKTSTLVYKGVSGDTATGGSDAALFFQNVNGRLYASIDFDLEKGSSIAVNIDPKLSAGTVKVYAALIGYTKDGGNQ